MASRKRRRAGGLDEGVDVPAEQRKRCVVTGACRGRACSTSNSALRSPANAPPALVTFAAKDKASNVTLSKDSTTVSCTKVRLPVLTPSGPHNAPPRPPSCAGLSQCPQHTGRVWGVLVR